MGNFNESKSLMIGLAAAAMVFSVLTVFGLAMKLPLDTRMVAALGGVPIAFFIPALVLVMTKMWNIYVTKDFENKDKNDIVKFITNAKSKATGMSSMASGMDSMASGMSAADSAMSHLEENEDPEVTKLEEALDAIKAQIQAA